MIFKGVMTLGLSIFFEKYFVFAIEADETL
jgi:hypothetical protein